MTQHLLDSHDLVHNPRNRRSKKTVHSSTASDPGGYGSSKQCVSASTSSKPSVVGLTCSSDLQQFRQPMITAPPAQLVPGYRFPFFPDTSYNPRNARPSYYYDAITPTVTMRGTQSWLLAIASQMSYASQFRNLSNTYYSQDQPQMPMQQQIFTPTTSQMFFQGAIIPPLSLPSSFASSLSFSDNSSDLSLLYTAVRWWPQARYIPRGWMLQFTHIRWIIDYLGKLGLSQS